MKDMERSNQDDINARFNRGSTRKSYREQLKLMHDELNDPSQFDVGEHIVKLLERLQLKMIILNFENVIFHSRYSGALKIDPELFLQLYRPCFIHLIASILSYSDSIIIGIITKEKTETIEAFFRFFLSSRSYEHFSDRFIVLENSYELFKSLPKELMTRNKYPFFECFRIYSHSKFHNLKISLKNILYFDDDSNCIEACIKTIHDGFYAFFSIENCLLPNVNLIDMKRYLEVEASNRRWL